LELILSIETIALNWSSLNL